MVSQNLGSLMETERKKKKMQMEQDENNYRRSVIKFSHIITAKTGHLADPNMEVNASKERRFK